MKEYQLAAGLFKTDPIAPECLLRSAVLRMELGNYEGARADLHDLLYRYPSFQGHDRAYLALGEANLRAGKPQDAIADFRRLYFLNISPGSQAGAAIGLGRCYFRSGGHDEAAKWLTRYLGLADAAREQGEAAEARLMLAACHAALGEPKQAEADYHRALEAGPSPAQRAKALFGLADLYLEAGRYAEALRAIGAVDADTLPSGEPLGRGPALTDYLVLVGRLYRRIGLPDQGIHFLKDRLAAVTGNPRRARVVLEIARGHAAAADHESAAGVYVEAIRELTPGVESRTATCELARLCLQLGRTGQAITLAGGVLDGPCEPELRARVAGILGSAYVLRGEYEKAAQAFALAREDGQVAAVDAADGRDEP
jgi:Tfp pilus assembly protein PilF